jgi:hypothetical protein
MKPFQLKSNSVLLYILVITTVVLIAYIAYSSSETNKKLTIKDQKIFRDSVVLAEKVKELFELKLAYLDLVREREEMTKVKDSLCVMVNTLTDMIVLIQKKDSINDKNIAQLNGLIKNAKTNLIKEKRLSPVIEIQKSKDADYSTYEIEEAKKTHSASLGNYGSSISEDQNEVEITNFRLEPLNKKGKILSLVHCNHSEVHSIRVAFSIPASEYKTPVEKTFTVKLIEPTGQEYKLDPEFDYIVNKNTKVYLTNKKRISYDGNEANIAFLYPKNTSYKAGINTIQLFLDNTFIAEQSIIMQ